MSRCSPTWTGNFIIVRALKLKTHREWLTLNLLSQHGPPDSPYVGGEYHGVLLFPSEYPFKPPGIKVRRVASALGSTFLTCVARCTRRLVVSNQTRKYVFPCLTFTLALCVDFPSLLTCAVVYVDLVLLVEPCVERCHNVRSKIVALRYNCHSELFAFCSFRLTGLVSFMLSDEMTTGSVTTSDTDKRVYASRSHSWNLQQRRFREAFPEVSTCILFMRGRWSECCRHSCVLCCIQEHNR